MAGAKHKKARRAESKLPEAARGWRPGAFWVALAGFTAAVLIFYWIPLTSPDTTPQWDTIDYHYSV